MAVELEWQSNSIVPDEREYAQKLEVIETLLTRESECSQSTVN